MKCLKDLVCASAMMMSVAFVLCGCSGVGRSAASTSYQVLSFSPPSSQVSLGGAAVTLSATTTSDLPVSYTSNTAPVCTVSGSTLTPVSVGTCSVTASQAGNTTYAAALPLTITFAIDGVAQTITFAPVTAPTIGSTATLSATASSGLAVSFTAAPSSVCTLSGDVLTAVAAGTCTVTASQAGNSTYGAAPSVPQTLTIVSSTPGGTDNFASGFTNSMVTIDGGAILTYSGGTPDSWGCTNTAGVSQCGSGSSAGTSDATSDIYVYYQTFAPIDGSSGGNFVGMTVFAPGVTTLGTAGDTGGLTLNGQTSMAFTFNSNAEWVTATGTPNILVELTMGNYYAATSCNVVLYTVLQAAGGATPTLYTIPLSDFAVKTNCGDSTITSVAAAFAQPISEINFQGDGGTAAITINGVTTNANLTTAVAGSSPAVYPTTLVLTGPITFQ